MENLFYLFDRIEPLEEVLRNYILSSLQRVEFPKKKIILKEGNIARNIYFIESGLIRSYEIINGKERTMWFMKENDLFLSVSSFFSQVPAIETIEALEPCVCYFIAYEQLQYAYKEFRQFNLHRGVILEKYYEFSEARNRMRMRRAAYRYEFLMAHEPELIGRVPDKYLASYLGVSKSSFISHKHHLANGLKKG